MAPWKSNKYMRPTGIPPSLWEAISKLPAWVARPVCLCSLGRDVFRQVCAATQAIVATHKAHEHTRREAVSPLRRTQE